MKIDAVGIIFSNMHDESMTELTSRRTMASVPFGGRYRLIDFVLSNMVNSGINKVGVITKSNYQSLLDHLGSGKEWELSHKRQGLFILPPFGHAQVGIYKSRIEALSGIRTFIHRCTEENVILCDCNEICSMDFRVPLEFHNQNHADITSVCKRRPRRDTVSEETVVYSTDPTGRAKDIFINPDFSGESLMGVNIWIVRKTFLENVVANMASRGVESWERGVLLGGVRDYRIFCWEFDGYMAHIGTMNDYFRMNMDLLDADVRRQLFHRYGPVYTKVRDEEPAKYGSSASAVNSLVADGCVVEGTVENSILFRGVYVGRNAVVKNSIIMQSSRLEENARLNYAIIDKDATIGSGRSLMGYETYPMYISKNSIV